MLSVPDSLPFVSTPTHALRREPAAVAGSLQPLPTAAAHNELAVLAAVIGREEPLSLRAISRLTTLPTCEVQTALDGLWRAGLVLRLNTLIESYAPRS